MCAFLLSLFAALSIAAPNPVDQVGFDQHPGRQLPLDATFRDETGRKVRLGDYFGKRPVILVPTYFDCPNLCTLVLNGVVEGLRRVALRPGSDFEVVAMSISPEETPQLAAKKKAVYLAHYGVPASAAGWHFLTGEGASIEQVTGALGFRYFYDKDQKQYAHPAGVAMLTPQGRISRTLFGVQYLPQDLRLGLIEASAGRTGSLTDRLLLLCFHYDPHTGRYGPLIENWLRAIALATAGALAGFIFVALRRDRLRKTQGER